MTHSYTWSHGIDNASSLRNNGTGNIYDSRLDRGNSDTDIRHRYVGSVIYDLPFFKGRPESCATFWAAGMSRP